MPSLVYGTRISRLITVAAVLAVSVASSACKDDPTAPKKVVAGPATLPINSTVAAAIVGSTYSIPGGAGALSSTVAGQNLALAFGGTSAAPTAAMTITSPTGAPVGTISATVTFGSCIFRITASSFTTGPLSVGQLITVNPCALTINFAGTPADGATSNVPTVLNFGGTPSNPVTLPISVSPTGTVSLGGFPVGTVPVNPATGT